MRALDGSELVAVEGGQMSECEVRIRTYVFDFFGPGAGGIADDLVWWFC
jgi:hypothetical protein